MLVWDSYWADDHVVVAADVATDVAAASDDDDNGHGDAVIVPSVPAAI